MSDAPRLHKIKAAGLKKFTNLICSIVYRSSRVPIEGTISIHFAIGYRNSDGALSERQISDIVPAGEDTIEAYCHLRNERRTFRVSRITQVTDPTTGEIIANPWHALGLSGPLASSPNPFAVVGPILPAVLALKHFAKKTRGFAKRERAHVLTFIAKHVANSEVSAAAIETWMVSVWAGDEDSYRANLERIPASLRGNCRATARQIAKGSGRQPITQQVLAVIDEDFP